MTVKAQPAPAGPAARRDGDRQHDRRRPPRIPPSMFGIPFGIAGLAEAWQAAGPLLADLRAPVLAPFVPVAAISAMLLAVALAGPAPAAGRVAVRVFLAVTIAVGGWLTGQWITGDLDRDRVHPGYFLPTVAGGLVGAFAAAQVHQHALAASFGIGILCWILLGSIVLNQLFLRPGLPPALVPTLSIELAPPVVAGVAYFAMTGDAANFISYALAG